MSELTFELTEVHLQFLNQKLEGLAPEKIVEWAMLTLPNLYQTTAFGLTGLVITDLISKIKTNHNSAHPVDLIFIDTLHHFNETLELVGRVENKYFAKVHTYKPYDCESKQEFANKYGENLWDTNEDNYDYLVKVEPANRAYKELQVGAVFTGRRKSQKGARSQIPILEKDSTGIIKINPLANWTFNQIKDYVNQNGVPYNPLLDQGYLSIGDYHSTAPAKDINDERSGRWVGKAKTECGLHKDYFKMKANFKPIDPMST